MMTSGKSKLLATFLLFGLLLGACGNPNPNPQPAELTPIPTLAPAATLTLNPDIQGSSVGSSAASQIGNNPAAGAIVFLQNCSPCHGAEGQGISGLPLRNNQFIQNSDQGAIYQVIANGRSGTHMPAWLQSNGGPLSSTQINNVIAYLATLQGLEAIPPATPEPEEATETPPPPGGPKPEPAKPSRGGQPGAAASLSGDPAKGQVLFGQVCAPCHGPQGVLGVPNPGSEDGRVPPLNPIDATLVSSDQATFAANLDLFIEHGSVPDGEGPQIDMPSFGDSKMLSDQQIADLIAYVIQLNRTQ